ncbi:MAG: hypothetical protein OXR66_01000 [Candidatus Woesearchaeota archaeon]|nr:hypothetical protein [Candidatus Woesearchaeota archaeon]
MEERKDISSKTILVLVVLTLTVSFISAWVSFSTTLTSPPTQESVYAPSSSQGKVHFVINDPSRAEPRIDGATGKVAFTIEK